MDPPIFRGGELSDELVLNDELDDLFAQAPGRKGPNGRSFPLDLEGGMVDVLLGHPGVTLGGSFADVVGRGDVGFLRLATACTWWLGSYRLPEPILIVSCSSIFLP